MRFFLIHVFGKDWCHHNILNNGLKWKQIEFLENHSDFLTEFADVTILIEKILSLILYGSACRSFKLIDAS